MFAISFFVSSRFGGWLTGKARYPTQEAAEADIRASVKDEQSRDITPFLRRPVAV